MLESIVAIIITALLGCVAFFFVRWMNNADEKIDSCHERHDKSEKRIENLERRSVNKQDYEMKIQQLEQADKEQKARMTANEGMTDDIVIRLKNVERERKQK